jgi:hypothetical protein
MSKTLVPLVSQNIATLVECHPQIISTPETKRYGLHFGIPAHADILIGYERAHVEKMFIHIGKGGILRIISEDEAKRQGILLIS